MAGKLYIAREGVSYLSKTDKGLHSGTFEKTEVFYEKELVEVTKEKDLHFQRSNTHFYTNIRNVTVLD